LDIHLPNKRYILMKDSVAELQKIKYNRLKQGETNGSKKLQ